MSFDIEVYFYIMTNRTQQEIMQRWEADNSDTPLVSVRCTAYNHEPYIAQALDGFLMQKTNFPFEVIVHDDASTDRTAEIIREYEARFPKIIKPIYETENQYSKRDGSLGRIMDAACKGKYIAFCEGDDYWTDENKLQMQVDFLEGNQEYGLCYTDYNTYNQQNGAMRYDLFKSGENKLSGEILLSDWILLKGYIAPMTWVYRKSVLKNYKSLHSLDGTFEMVAYFLYASKIKFLAQTTAVYRILAESASHSANFSTIYHRNRNLFETQSLLSRLYNLNLDVEIKKYYYNKAWKTLVANGNAEELNELIVYNTNKLVHFLVFSTKLRFIRELYKFIFFKFKKYK